MASARILILLLLVSYTINAQVSSPDESLAVNYSKKYKDDDVMLKSSYQFFTFDKGKNALGDKVVTIEEKYEYE